MDRCATCPHTHNQVLADGPTQARVLVVGEAPDHLANSLKRPLVGEQGKEFNYSYLVLAGLDRSEVRVTNTMQCKPELNRKPKPNEALTCAMNHLPETLMETQPEIIVLMGATAVNTLAPDVDLEVQHGVPFKGVVLGWECWIVVMWHPKSALYDTTMMVPLLEDWERLGPWLRDGSWQWAVESTLVRDYRLTRTAEEVLWYFRDHYGSCKFIGADTESHAGIPFSVQISTEVGTGLMVLEIDHEAMEMLAKCLNQFLYLHGDEMVFHNQESDLGRFELMMKKLLGAEFEPIPYRDTQQLAYHLQNLPQALKALSYRLLGRKRQSWQELVGGYSREKLTEWLWQARDWVIDNLSVMEEFRFHKKTGKLLKPLWIKHAWEPVLNRLLQHVNKPTYDPWDKLREAIGSKHLDILPLIAAVGEVPELGIANCPLDIARDYGCSDSDDTLALAYELEQLRIEAETQWAVQEADMDPVSVK